MNFQSSLDAAMHSIIGSHIMVIINNYLIIYYYFFIIFIIYYYLIIIINYSIIGSHTIHNWIVSFPWL